MRISFRLLLFSFALAFGLSTQGQPARADDATPKTLPLNQTITGTIKEGDRINYAFDVPADQDVVTVLESDKSMLDVVCSTDPATNYCGQGGGGGSGEYPTYSTNLFTANGQVQHRQIQLLRYKDGSADYRLTAYPLTPQPLGDGETHVSAPTDVPVQVYELGAHPNQAFSVEMEDDYKDGNFLWVAYQPYLYESIYETGDWLPRIGLLDHAEPSSETSPLRFMALHYAGGHKFHLAVGAKAGYTFHVAPITMTLLDPNRTVLLTVSYQQPIAVVRLQTLKMDVAHIQLQVTKGIGAWVSAYTAGNPQATYQALGVTPNSTDTVPLTATMEHAAKTNFGSYVVVQVPAQFTRDFATVSVQWSHDR